MVAVGCILGVLLVFWGNSWWGPFVLYVPWQAGYAAAFAAGVPVRATETGAG